MGSKFCGGCNQERPVEAFGKRVKSKDGLQTQCKECMYKAQRVWLKKRPEKTVEYNAIARKRMKQRYIEDSGHRERVKARVRAWKQLHPEQRKNTDRRAWLKNAYGLTLAQFETKCHVQNNKCGCCGEELKKPCVDHDHVTGQVRDLVCYGCNIRLQSKEKLLQALAYLRRHEGAEASTDVA